MLHAIGKAYKDGKISKDDAVELARIYYPCLSDTDAGRVPLNPVGSFGIMQSLYGNPESNTNESRKIDDSDILKMLELASNDIE